MAPHDSAAKNKGEYDSCVACYFRDELGGRSGGWRQRRRRQQRRRNRRARGWWDSRSQNDVAPLFSDETKTDKTRSKRDVDNRDGMGEGCKGEGDEAGDNKGLSRFCVWYIRCYSAGSGPCAHVFVIRALQLRRMSKDVYTYAQISQTRYMELRDCLRDSYRRVLRIYFV